MANLNIPLESFIRALNGVYSTLPPSVWYRGPGQLGRQTSTPASQATIDKADALAKQRYAESRANPVEAVANKYGKKYLDQIILKAKSFGMKSEAEREAMKEADPENYYLLQNVYAAIQNTKRKPQERDNVAKMILKRDFEKKSAPLTQEQINAQLGGEHDPAKFMTEQYATANKDLPVTDTMDPQSDLDLYKHIMADPEFADIFLFNRGKGMAPMGIRDRDGQRFFYEFGEGNPNVEGGKPFVPKELGRRTLTTDDTPLTSLYDRENISPEELAAFGMKYGDVLNSLIARGVTNGRDFDIASRYKDRLLPSSALSAIIGLPVSEEGVLHKTPMVEGNDGMLTVSDFVGQPNSMLKDEELPIEADEKGNVKVGKKLTLQEKEALDTERKEKRAKIADFLLNETLNGRLTSPLLANTLTDLKNVGGNFSVNNFLNEFMQMLEGQTITPQMQTTRVRRMPPSKAFPEGMVIPLRRFYDYDTDPKNWPSVYENTRIGLEEQRKDLERKLKEIENDPTYISGYEKQQALNKLINEAYANLKAQPMYPLTDAELEAGKAGAGLTYNPEEFTANGAPNYSRATGPIVDKVLLNNTLKKISRPPMRYRIPILSEGKPSFDYMAAFLSKYPGGITTEEWQALNAASVASEKLRAHKNYSPTKFDVSMFFPPPEGSTIEERQTPAGATNIDEVAKLVEGITGPRVASITAPAAKEKEADTEEKKPIMPFAESTNSLWAKYQRNRSRVPVMAENGTVDVVKTPTALLFKSRMKGSR